MTPRPADTPEPVERSEPAGTPEPEPGRGTGDPVRQRLSHLPWGLAASAVLLVVAVTAGGLARGAAGALGAALGVILVAVSYTFSSIVIAVADAIRPALVLPFGLAAYVAKFSAFGAILAAAGGSGWAGLVPLGIAIAAAAVIWSISQVIWLVRTQPPYRRPAGDEPPAAGR